MLKTKWLTVFVGLIGLLVFASTPAMAYLTPINPGSNSLTLGEDNLIPFAGSTKRVIMDYLYGSGRYTRIEDNLDQLWYDWDGGAVVEAKFAGYSQYLGYIEDSSGVPAPIISNITGSGYVSGFSGTFNPIGTFRFTDDPNGPTKSPQRWDSDQSKNPSNLDHMVTFSVDGYLATRGVDSSWTAYSDTRYVIAWEDQNLGDADYNDLVVEVEKVAPGTAPIPEPGTLLLLGTGLVGLAGYGLRRRKK